MNEDTGLWFLNGKVITREVRDKVWAAYDKRWERAYRAERKLEKRHQEELAALKAKTHAIMDSQPYTPYLGRIADGVTQQWLASAAAEHKWRKEKKP